MNSQIYFPHGLFPTLTQLKAPDSSSLPSLNGDDLCYPPVGGMGWRTAYGVLGWLSSPLTGSKLPALTFTVSGAHWFHKTHDRWWNGLGASWGCLLALGKSFWIWALLRPDLEKVPFEIKRHPLWKLWLTFHLPISLCASSFLSPKVSEKSGPFSKATHPPMFWILPTSQSQNLLLSDGTHFPMLQFTFILV